MWSTPRERLRLCVLGNALTVVLAVVPICILSADDGTYFRMGPAADFLLIGVKIDTYEKYALLLLFLAVMNAVKVVSEEIGMPILFTNIYLDKTEITDFRKTELQVYGNLMYALSGTRQIFATMIAITQFDIAMWSLFVCEGASVFTIRTLLNSKRFVVAASGAEDADTTELTTTINSECVYVSSSSESASWRLALRLTCPPNGRLLPFAGGAAVDVMFLSCSNLAWIVWNSCSNMASILMRSSTASWMLAFASATDASLRWCAHPRVSALNFLSSRPNATWMSTQGCSQPASRPVSSGNSGCGSNISCGSPPAGSGFSACSSSDTCDLMALIRRSIIAIARCCCCAIDRPTEPPFRRLRR